MFWKVNIWRVRTMIILSGSIIQTFKIRKRSLPTKWNENGSSYKDNSRVPNIIFHFLHGFGNLQFNQNHILTDGSTFHTLHLLPGRHLSANVCVCVYMYMCVCVCMCVHMCIYVCVCIYVYVCVYACVYVYICVCIWCVCIYIYMCVCVCVCIYIYMLFFFFWLEYTRVVWGQTTLLIWF